MFKYTPAMQGLQGLDYSGLTEEEQRRKQQAQGIDPNNAMNVAQQFMGGSGAGVATGSQAAGNALAAEGIGGAGSVGGGGWAGGSAAGGGSAVASAGPWAALAAIIYANEYNAVGGGYRSKDKGQYTQDLFSGEVLGQDMEKRWLPKLGMKEGSKENKWISHLVHPISADLGESWDSFKDLF